MAVDPETYRMTHEILDALEPFNIEIGEAVVEIARATSSVWAAFAAQMEALDDLLGED